MKTPQAIQMLDASLDRFMRYFLVHINPILHRTEYRGRSYSEYEIIVVMALGLVGSTRPVDLSRALSIEKGTMTSLIRRLRGLGLVEARHRRRRAQLSGGADGCRTEVQAASEEQRHRELRALFAAMDGEEIVAAARGFDLLSAYLKSVEETHVRLGDETASRRRP